MKIRRLLVFVLLAFLTSSCSKCVDTGKGCLMLKLSNDGFFTSTKALDEASYRNVANYDVKIQNAVTGAVVLNCKSSELSSETPLELEMGAYDIVASYGKEAAASRDFFYVEGKASILLQPDESLPLTIECKPTCGKLSVSFDAEMDKYYSDYYIDYRGTLALGENSIRFAKGETEPWYVKLVPAGEDIEYTLTLVAKDGYRTVDGEGQAQQSTTVSGSFRLQRNKARKLSVKPDYKPSDGSLGISVTVDEGTDDRNVDIEVPVSWI